MTNVSNFSFSLPSKGRPGVAPLLHGRPHLNTLTGAQSLYRPALLWCFIFGLIGAFPPRSWVFRAALPRFAVLPLDALFLLPFTEAIRPSKATELRLILFKMFAFRVSTLSLRIEKCILPTIRRDASFSGVGGLLPAPAISN